MVDINDRIRQVRENLDLSRNAFGKALGVSESVIRNLDYKLTTPKEPFITLLCDTYNIDKTWLTTGTGEMLRKRSEEEMINDLIASLIESITDVKRKRIVKTILETVAEIPEEFYPYILKFSKSITEALQPDSPAEAQSQKLRTAKMIARSPDSDGKPHLITDEETLSRLESAPESDDDL